MNCPGCQFENPPSALFCDECGTRLESPCSNCGEANRGTAKFCRNCGQTLNQTQSPDPVPIGPALGQYVPKHLADKIRACQHIIEGERKQVTVLFADIRGSTKLLDGLDPEEAQKTIDPVLHVMMDAVHRYEGTVNQVLGDGVMALFGAPLAHEDHALRACYTALAMQEEMRRYREKLGQSEQSGIQIGIGMNTGEVVVRSIDNDLNLDYSAVGLTTHLAARMQERSRGGSSLMTASTLHEVEGFVQVKSLGEVQAKGVSRPVEVFELVAATSARTRVQAAAARGLTPFVGREAEIELFEKLIEQTMAGRGEILAMVGEPGMGKSRLVYEFTHFHAPAGWLAIEGASVSYDKATPYFPLIELLRRYFSIGDSDDSQHIQQKVLMQVVELDAALKDVIAPILSLLIELPAKSSVAVDQTFNLAQFPDVIDACASFNDMEPEQRRRQCLEALKRLFVRESQKQPLILVFEDLHWIDNETQAFLDSLVDSLPLARILLLVDYRPGYAHAWGDKTYYAQLRVEPLRSASAVELLQNLLGRHKDLAPLKQMLIERTEGNPFFAEESVRSLVATGVLIGEKGAYRPGLRINGITLPSTVQNLVADRIDRLSIEEKHLLQTAAVIGVIVPMPLLRAVATLPDKDLYSGLSALQAADFLYESNLFPEVEYRFRHALINEVAYGALLHARRIAIHGRIVQALEQSTGTVAHDHVEQLAHHAFYAELWDKAVVFLKEAGAKAAARSSYRNAVLRFEQALGALRHLPETNDTLGDAVDLRVAIRNAFFILGEFRRGLPYLEEAQSAALALQDRRRLGTVFQLMTAHWNLEGNSERAIAFGIEALRHTTEPEYVDLEIPARYFLGAAYHSIGQYHEAADVFDRAITLIGNRRKEHFGTTGSLYVICRAWLARCLAQLGDLTEAIPFADESVKTAIEYGHPYSLVYAYYAAGVLFLIKGEFDKSVSVLERGLQVCQTSDLPVHYPLVASCLGSAYASVGRSNDALEYLREAVEHPAWATRLGGQSLRMVWVADGYLRLGRFEEAEIFVRRGLELTAESKDKGSRAWLLRIMGEILAQRRSTDRSEAVADYEEARTLARELKMRPLEAHCHLGLGTLHTRSGNPQNGHSEIDAAAKLYRAMSMHSWLSVTEEAYGKKHLPA